MSDYYWSSPDAAYSMDYIGNKLACERAPPLCQYTSFCPSWGSGVHPLNAGLIVFECRSLQVELNLRRELIGKRHNMQAW